MESDIERRYRRLRFRAWRRGMKEMDLLMGTFADRYLDKVDESELAAFENLLDLPDDQLFSWIIGTDPIPESSRSLLLERLCRIYLESGEVSSDISVRCCG